MFITFKADAPLSKKAKKETFNREQQATEGKPN